MKNLIGKTINQYQILLKIREIGTRILFKVYDTKNKRNLALEVVKLEENIDYSELFDLLKAQANQNARLIQSNIAVVIDSGMFDGIPYFVYNFSPFQPLHRLFNQKFSWRDSAQNLVAITQAVAYAHEKGVVHGFLSPANIILDENKNPYLFDFGFEQIIQNYLISSLPGSWINNSDYAYCSPEQLIGFAIDERSDVYAIGLILYEWMTGEIIFLEETALGTLYKRKTSPDNVLNLTKVAIPEIRNVIEKCIASNPEDRYQSIQELSVLLARGALDINITKEMVEKPLTTQVATSPNRWRMILILLITLTSIVAIFGIANIAKPASPQINSLPLVSPVASPTKKIITFTSTPVSTPIQPTATEVIIKIQVPNRINYPVLEGTMLPGSLPKISPENSVRLITLSRWGIGELNRLAISPDGSMFAVASPVGVFLYNSTGVTLQKYLDTSSWVSVVEFSPDGKRLAIGDRDGLITVWDTASWNVVENHSGHKAGILDLAFSPDGSALVSIAADNKLIKWSATGESISVPVNELTSLDYSSDGTKIITGGNDAKINLWNAANLSLLKPITHSSKVVDIKIVHDTSTLVIGGADRNVTLVDIDTLEKSRPFVGLKNALSYITISPDGSEIVASDIFGGIVAWSKSGTWLWEVPTRVEGFTPSGNVLGVNHTLVFSPNGKTIISGLRNGTIRVYDALTGNEIKKNDSLNIRADKLVISHNSNFVLTQNNYGQLKMWDVHSGKLLFQVTGTMKQGGVFSLNDEYFAVQANPTTVKVFETTSSKEVFTFNSLQNIQAIQFVQNDRFLAVGNSTQVGIWSMISGQKIQTNNELDGTGCTAVKALNGTPLLHITTYNYIPKDIELVSFCAFQKVAWMKAVSINESNSIIAYAGNSKLGVAGSLGEFYDMDGVNRINFEKVANNSENTLLAVAFDDHSIGIWDRTTKKKIMQLFGPDNAITDLQFSPDGTLLLSSSLDGTIRIWGIP